MTGKSILIWLGLTCAASGVLYQTSYSVQEQQARLSQLKHQIVTEQEAIQVLKAEWAYLNDPHYIERLTNEHLVLQPTRGLQMATLDQIPRKDLTLLASQVTSPIPQRKPGSRPPAPSVATLPNARTPGTPRPAPQLAALTPRPDTQMAPPMVLARYGAAR